jgi:uncharacterized protein
MTPRQVHARLIDGITARRWSELARLYAQDAEVEMPMAIPGPRHLKGRDAIHAHFTAAAHGPLRFEVGQVTVHETTDPEVIVAEFEYDLRVATTGHRLRCANVQVVRVRDGLIVSSRDYHDHAAIAAALAP